MFSPEALAGLNSTYSAQRVSAKEARAWAEKKGQEWAIAQVHDQIETGKQLYLINGDILTEDQLDEQYRSCEKCGALVLSEPLTWGVMQYQERDGDIVCNGCFTKRTTDGAKVALGIDSHWPRLGSAGITMDVLRHALDERVVEDALVAAGYEKVLEQGVEGVEYGVTPESALEMCQRELAMYPQTLFVATRVAWQFCADLTLWRKGA